MRLHEILFSPTGGTKKAADLIARGISCDYDTVDLTDSSVNFSEISYQKEDVCLFAVPSYSGRVPSAAIQRIGSIKGQNTPAVLMVVYGNRAYEDTLLELYDTAVKNGFIPAAAVAALAEHSIVRSVAKNRPDEKDEKQLREFAEIIRDRLEKKEFPLLSLPGNRPYRQVKKGTMIPSGNENCVSCGQCAKACPVGAIPMELPRYTNPDLCISCMRCVWICPENARSLPENQLSAITEKLTALCRERKENELF